MAADILTVGIVALYFIGMLAIGAWASKKIKNTEDYLVAGRSLGFWVFVLLMIGTVASGMSLLGVSGLGFKAGWPTIWEQIFVPLSIGFCIIFFGVKLHNVAKTSGYVTVQDYLAHRYESPTALRTLSAVAGIIVSLIYLVGQYSAIAIVLMWLFQIPLWLALIIATLITTIYTAIGGLYAVAWASLIQSAILIIGVLIMAPIIIFYAGGFTHVNEFMATINPNLVMPWNPSGAFAIPYIASFAVLLMVGLACAPHVINNVLAIKDVKYFKWAPLIAFVIYGVAMFLLKFTGFAGAVMVKEGVFTLPQVPNAGDFVILYGIQYCPPDHGALGDLCGHRACGSHVDYRPADAHHRRHVSPGMSTRKSSSRMRRQDRPPPLESRRHPLCALHHAPRHQPPRDARDPHLDGYRRHALNLCRPAPRRPVLAGRNPGRCPCRDGASASSRRLPSACSITSRRMCSGSISAPSRSISRPTRSSSRSSRWSSSAC